MRWKFWQKNKIDTSPRKVNANDAVFNAQFKYANNYISTSKYNIITFLPKNLLEQFSRMANIYFLFLLVLQLIPQISSLSYVTTIVPLVFVLSISALKDAIDDIRRHRNDSIVNNRKTLVLRDGQLIEAKWQKIVVGDIIKMVNNQFVAADLLLLSASEPNSLCYIETAELDGETNLKVRQALPATAMMEADVQKLANFKGEVTCEAPNNNLNKFEGRLDFNGAQYSLDNDKVLLRGCVLRNTEWCYGMVLFAGRDSKLMMNSGKTKFKRTHIDRLMNILIIGIFCFLIAICLMCTIGAGIWETNYGFNFQAYLPWESFVPGSTMWDGDVNKKAAGATVISILVFFSYIIVLNTVVPISLYVSVEMIRFGHSFWINWDNQMFYKKTKTNAKARTTTLNEELGQIEYIFSDKTGTLTQNIMTFNKCSINGLAYGDVLDKHGKAVDITDMTPKVDFSANPYYESTFDFYDQRLLRHCRENNPEVAEFFRLLALCHTVMSQEKNGSLEYQAQSPDEAALVGAARNFGFVYKTRTPTTITISVNGKEEVYDQLCILDFNNDRKRMSIIVRREGKIKLLCKGADSLIYARLHQSSSSLKDITTIHLEAFAQDGLRTLCLAYKNIDDNYFKDWQSRQHEASTSLENRDEKLQELYEEIERDMILIGATAIEDKLQDGVPETIANLAKADIKIWVLTGDKQETAINIGYSCHLLTEEMSNTLYVIDAEDFEGVRDQLANAKDEIVNLMNKGGLGFLNPAMSNSFDQLNKTPNGTLPGNVSSTDFGLIINGFSLVHALKPELELLLLETGCICKAVICCRVTPLQKALVVNLVKKNKNSITLAIGDGANDVSMIKAAHIGIGISGQEGMQAVLASDFSIAQFRYLERLLLVHGRWSYLRMCKFLKYFFYKNFAFTLCHFWFSFFCGFSAQTVYDPYFITFYNVFYTSLPVMMLGLFDQDVNEKVSIQYPRLYTPGHIDLFFNKKVFAQSVCEGLLTSLVIFFVPYAAFTDAIQPGGTDLAGHRVLGVVIAACLIVAVTLRCGLDTYYWTGFNHFTIWGSIIFFFIFTFLMYLPSLNYTYSGTFHNLMSTANFWFTLLLTVVVILIPVVAERFYFIDTRPTLVDRLRVAEKVGKIKAKVTKSKIVRRASTTRRSQRSVGRSGYAFSHQEGFGELITSGSIMRKKDKGKFGQNDASTAQLTNFSHPRQSNSIIGHADFNLPSNMNPLPIIVESSTDPRSPNLSPAIFEPILLNFDAPRGSLSDVKIEVVERDGVGKKKKVPTATLR